MATIPPTVYDTTGLDSTTAAQMAQLVASDSASGKPFTLTGPNATAIATAAAAVNGSTLASTGAPATGTGGAAGNGWDSGAIAGSIQNGQFQANPNSPMQQAQVLGGPGTAGSTVQGWFAAHLGNYGLVALGVLLGLGALLISNKDTIVNVGTKVAKAVAA